MNNREMKKVAVFASLFFAASVSVMLHRSITKQILITDAAASPIEKEDSHNGYTLIVDKNVPEGKENSLIIPLAKSVSSDNIILEDRYADHELRIYIDSEEADFYRNNPVLTDLDIIENSFCITRNDSGNVCLDFKLDGLYANESSLTESSSIEVKFCRPSQKYDRIVVVDPFGGGSITGAGEESLLEKDAVLDTALLLKKIADNDSENNLKIYFTRLKDTEVPLEKRAALIRDSGAQILVELTADGGGSNEQGMSAYYNDSFYLRSLTNAETADALLSNSSGKTGTTARGVFPAEGDLLLDGSVIPSARLDIGNLSDLSDCEKLMDDEYKKKLAEGIYNGILQAYEVMR